MKYFPELMKAAHTTAVAKGWWEKPPSTETIICLIHTEISEAFEEFRKHGLDTEKFLYFERDGFGNLKPEGIAVELADVVIRLMDWCEHEGWELEWQHTMGGTSRHFAVCINHLHGCCRDIYDGCDGNVQDLLSEAIDIGLEHDLPLEDAIRVKMAYNETRPYKHGGKGC